MWDGDFLRRVGFWQWGIAGYPNAWFPLFEVGIVKTYHFNWKRIPAVKAWIRSLTPTLGCSVVVNYVKTARIRLNRDQSHHLCLLLCNLKCSNLHFFSISIMQARRTESHYLFISNTWTWCRYGCYQMSPTNENLGKFAFQALKVNLNALQWTESFLVTRSLTCWVGGWGWGVNTGQFLRWSGNISS